MTNQSLMKKFLLGLVFVAMTFAVGAREPQEGWKQLGTGLFCDDLISVIDERSEEHTSEL